jgi:hypothetical protein
MKPRKLHIAGALIILAWLASLGWLVRREYFGRTPGEVAASARVAPGAVFFAIYLNGGQIGTGATTVDTLSDGVRISSRADVLLPDGGGSRRIRTASEVRLAPSLALTSFEHSVAGDAPEVTLQVRRGDEALRLSLAWPGRAAGEAFAPLSALPDLAVPIRAVASGPLEEGRRIDVPLIDPLTGAVRPATFVVRAPVQFVVPDSALLDSIRRVWVPAHMDSVTAWELEDEASTVRTRMWVDQQGFIVRAETPEGWTILRTAFEIAQLNLRAGRPHRIATPPLNHSAQAMVGFAPNVTPADTAPAPLVPSGARSIDSLADRLAPDALPAEVRARALFDFVARRIAPAAGPPDAEAALLTRRGSAASRALLLTALGRAAGIPARAVSGARFADGEWRPEVWVSLRLGEWIDVDPVRRAWGADSLRYPFRFDGGGHPLEVLAPTARLLRPRIPDAPGRTP